MPNQVTFDVSRHQKAIDDGVSMLRDMNEELSFRIVLGIHPTYKFSKKRLFGVRSKARTYLEIMNELSSDDSYMLSEYGSDSGVGWVAVMEIADEIRALRKIYRRVLVLSDRGRRRTMRYSVSATRKYIRMELYKLSNYSQ